MKFLIIVSIVLCFGFFQIIADPIQEKFVLLNDSMKWNESEITGYHFHTYYFQNNIQSKRIAADFRY